jgi:hypothetical protein
VGRGAALGTARPLNRDRAPAGALAIGAPLCDGPRVRHAAPDGRPLFAARQEWSTSARQKWSTHPWAQSEARRVARSAILRAPRRATTAQPRLASRGAPSRHAIRSSASRRSWLIARSTSWPRASTWRCGSASSPTARSSPAA